MSRQPEKIVEGILVAALTPRIDGSASIDLPAAIELSKFLESHDVNGIVLLGSTGEFLHFTPEERTRLVSEVVKHTHLPILSNVSHSTLDGTVALGRAAVDAGAAAVLVMPPYYFRYSQESIREFFIEAADRIDAPVFLYNIPFLTSGIDLETSLDLLATRRFAGIKDSYGRWEDFVALQTFAEAHGLAVYCGSDAMYSRARRAGAAGAVTGVACVAPELMVAIEQRTRASLDTTDFDALVVDFVEQFGRFAFPAAVREAAAIRGLHPGPHAAPLGPNECRKMEEFRGWFRNWLAKVQKIC